MNLDAIFKKADTDNFIKLLDQKIAIKLPNQANIIGIDKALNSGIFPLWDDINDYSKYLFYSVVDFQKEHCDFIMKVKYNDTYITSLYIEPKRQIKRYRFDLSYDGTLYEGYQRQPYKKTIQGEIEAVLKHLLQKHIDTYSASRTDAGVHAQQQVFHADLDTPLSIEKLQLLMNKMLPNDIYIYHIEHVPQVFHARYDTLEKTYTYTLHHKRNPFKSKYSLYHKSFDLNQANGLLDKIIGTHDFINFSKKNTKTSTVRTITKAFAYKRDEDTVIEITGNGFLRHMVRMIVGVLLRDMDKHTTHIKYALNATSIGTQKYTAPSEALCLKHIRYK